MILGAILAGGRSSRFGSDKGVALLHGRTLIDHAGAVLAPHVAAVVLCGRSRDDWVCTDDRPRQGLGPLGGIAGALHRAARTGYSSVLTIACDMPAVPPELIASLAAVCPSYCADSPTLAHWPAGAAATLEAHLSRVIDASAEAEGKAPELSVRRWADGIGARPICAPGPLANVNTPADLTAL